MQFDRYREINKNAGGNAAADGDEENYKDSEDIAVPLLPHL